MWRGLATTDFKAWAPVIYRKELICIMKDTWKWINIDGSRDNLRGKTTNSRTAVEPDGSPGKKCTYLCQQLFGTDQPKTCYLQLPSTKCSVNLYALPFWASNTFPTRFGKAFRNHWEPKHESQAKSKKTWNTQTKKFIPPGQLIVFKMLNLCRRIFFHAACFKRNVTYIIIYI